MRNYSLFEVPLVLSGYIDIIFIIKMIMIIVIVIIKRKASMTSIPENTFVGVCFEKAVSVKSIPNTDLLLGYISEKKIIKYKRMLP